jgi:hypothetical protein
VAILGRSSTEAGASSTLPTAQCNRAARQLPKAMDPVSVVCTVNAESLQELRMDRNDFLTVLCCEESPRFRTGRRRGKKKRERSNVSQLLQFHVDSSFRSRTAGLSNTDFLWVPEDIKYIYNN